ncbi:hypothetical protein [Nocardioides ultimimeridianus]
MTNTHSPACRVLELRYGDDSHRGPSLTTVTIATSQCPKAVKVAAHQ